MPRPRPQPSDLPERQLRQALSRVLLKWFRGAQRPMPWRETRDPYAIWVSEVMLQQTQVATVIPYFQRWMKRFPSLKSLAAANEQQVLSSWQGLGYYSRARSLRKGAAEVVQHYGGRLPESTQALRQLPGVGPYTAGAIASIAFNHNEPAVDGNVIRVLSRLFALTGDPLKEPLKSHLWQLAAHLIPTGNAREFNQALMELGAQICTPKQPLCPECPARRLCQARMQNRVAELPTPKPRPQVTRLNHVAALVTRRGRFLLIQRSAEASRWASMWQFPNVEARPHETAQDAAVRAVLEFTGRPAQAGAKRDETVFPVTRYRITLELYDCELDSGRVRARGCAQTRWCDPEELGHFAMPAAYRRLARKLTRGDT